MARIDELKQLARDARASGNIDVYRRAIDAVEAETLAMQNTKNQQSEQSAKPVEAERGIVDIATGRDLMTEQISSLQEIGGAPELNEMSLGALKASFGLLSTGDDSELRGILSKQFGEKVSFSEDSKGNTIVTLPSGQYALNKPGVSGQDVVRALFDAAAFTPAGKAATIPAAITKMATTEALLEAGESAVGGTFDPQQVALSGAMGGTFKGLEDVVGTAYRALRGTPDNAIVQAGKEVGVPVMTSDVFPPKTFGGQAVSRFAEQIPIAGTGGKRQVQQLFREEAVEELGQKYGIHSYKAIIDSLKAQKNKIKSAAGGVLEKTGTKLDDVGSIPITSTRAAINEAREELSKAGVIQTSDAVSKLDVLLEALDSAPQTFTTIKENRTAFRELLESVDPAARSQLGSRALGILRRVERGLTKDMEGFAKANLSPKEYSGWKRANAIYADQAQTLKKSRLKNVLDKGDVAPESVQTMLFSQKPSEVELLYKGLTSEGRSNARAAFIDKIFSDSARTKGGATPSAIAAQLKRYPNQVKILFKGDDRRQLEGLARVLSATNKAQDTNVYTQSGMQAIPWIGTYMAGTSPVTTGAALGTVGGLSRLYESQPVRDALLRVASVPKGSTAFEKAVADATLALQVAAQGAREQTEGVKKKRQVEQ